MGLMISPIHIFPNKQKLAQAVAGQSIDMLRQSIAAHGNAIWVLAGGSTPDAAYQIIADQYLKAVDWSKVTFIMGDERIAPLDSPDSNWHIAHQLLLQYIPQATLLRPISDQPAEVAAAQYNAVLNTLPKTNNGYPRFDLVWLGMGEDGHTLSLFPGHSDAGQNDHLVIPVHDSPKPPGDRITLAYQALAGAGQCMIMVTGSSKAAAVKQVQAGADLPIVTAARIPKNTVWYLDEAAGKGV